ncbi:MAG: isopentenyl-diphosphate Delta-isomerase [Minisyncoccales bacterium]
MLKEKVILVDKNDKEIGSEEKLKAHVLGKRHRAFSLFIFNKKGELLLQKRAKEKYHSGGLWTNSCCSHPRPNEDLEKAVQRRVKEELGITIKKVKKIGKIHYKRKIGRLIENEIDHIFSTVWNGKPKINKKEVEKTKWIKMEDLKREIKKEPKKFTVWLKIILKKIKKWK